MIPPYFIRHVTYPLNLARIGSNEGAYLKQLEESQWFSREDLERLQWTKLKKLLNHAYETVPYYRKRFKEEGVKPSDIRNPEDFIRVPILTRKLLNENLKELVSKNYPTRRLTLDYSGGSTGEPVRFYKDKRKIEYGFAVTIRHDRWSGWDIGEKIGLLWGARRDMSPKGRLRSKARNLLVYPNLELDAFRMDDTVMRDYARRLVKYRPKILLAYANAAYVFAGFVRDEGIKNINLEGIITSAETLFPHQRKLIEEVFGCKVFNRYGSREFGNMASQCPQGGMHVCSEGFVLEILKDGKPAAPEEQGEIAVTDLSNYGMPFIRYAIGDMGVQTGGKCSCSRGLPLIGNITGRISDNIIAEDGKVIPGNFFVDLVGRSMIGVEKYQFIQETQNRLTLKIVKSKRFHEKDLDFILLNLREKMGGVDIHVDVVEDIKPTETGKHRFTISKVST